MLKNASFQMYSEDIKFSSSIFGVGADLKNVVQ